MDRVGPTALAVDGEAVMLRAVERVLLRGGYSPFPASDPVEAVRRPRVADVNGTTASGRAEWAAELDEAIREYIASTRDLLDTTKDVLSGVPPLDGVTRPDLRARPGASLREISTGSKSIERLA